MRWAVDQIDCSHGETNCNDLHWRVGTLQLPEPKERIRSQTISKMASASGTWQDRQVGLLLGLPA
jgi:hypothetical protein